MTPADVIILILAIAAVAGAGIWRWHRHRKGEGGCGCAGCSGGGDDKKCTACPPLSAAPDKTSDEISPK